MVARRDCGEVDFARLCRSLDKELPGYGFGPDGSNVGGLEMRRWPGSVHHRPLVVRVACILRSRGLPSEVQKKILVEFVGVYELSPDPRSVGRHPRKALRAYYGDCLPWPDMRASWMRERVWIPRDRVRAGVCLDTYLLAFNAPPWTVVEVETILEAMRRQLGLEPAPRLAWWWRHLALCVRPDAR